VTDERTALIIKVPDACRIADLPGAFSEGRRLGVPPHVTLVTPFAPLDEWQTSTGSRLGAVLDSVARFDATFSRVERFPDGTRWLAPDDPGPFIRLIERILAAFPGFPPYGGIHDGIVPHLSIGDADPSAVLARGPFSVSVHEVVLGSYTADADSWQDHHRMALSVRATGAS
jgi:hypothetical protein